MRLFLDTSVLLAASGSLAGASRELFARATANEWLLIATPYALRNLPEMGAHAAAEWAHLRPALTLMDDVLTLDRPVLFGAAKDRPVLFSALAWADVLLTLDRDDFAELLNQSFYGLDVLTPGMFLQRERAAARLR